MRFARIDLVMLTLLCALAALGPARAQEGESTRAVRIIESDPQQPARNPVPAIPPVNLSAKLDNPAGVNLELLPGADLRVGARVTFRITTRRPGYLVLLDVDAAGKLSQVWPSRAMLIAPPGSGDVPNLVRPGKAVSIPEEGPAGFELVVSPPTGIAMIVAVLSDRPVQVLDLPDVPAELAGKVEALKYLTDAARSLRLASSERGSRFVEPRLSFNAKFYRVQ